MDQQIDIINGNVINGNMNPIPTPQSTLTSISCVSTNLDPSDAMIELLDNGLVEALITVNQGTGESKLWHDAYIIDCEDVGQLSSSNSASNAIISVVLAIEGEDHSVTIANQTNVYMCTMDQIRFKLPQTSSDKPMNVDIGMKVDVRTESRAPFICWETGTVQRFNEDYFVVQFETKKSVDIIPKSRVRATNSNVSLTELGINPFYQFSIAFSNELLKVVHDNMEWLASKDLHKDFKKVLKLITVYSDRKTKSLVCIGYTTKEKEFARHQMINRAQLLATMHFEKLRDDYFYRNRTKTITGINSTIIGKEYILNVVVEKKYVGLGVGRGGANIQKARNIPGIYSVELNEPRSTFVIIGDSLESCENAATIVNFREELISFPPDYEMLLSDAKFMNEIINKLGIYKVEYWIHSQTQSGKNELLVLGKHKSIQDFKLLIDYQKVEQDEINQLKCLRNQLFQNLYNSSHKLIHWLKTLPKLSS